MQIFQKGGIVFRATHAKHELCGASHPAGRKEGELFVDASGIKEKEAVVTHAHSDHAKTSLTNTYYLTPQTASLLNCAQKNIAVSEIPFGKTFKVGEFSCKFHPSGHILGSAQLEVANGTEAVLTSDFKLQKSILFDGAEILPSEVLIIETTFGTPEYTFPEREEVYADIVKWSQAALAQKHFIVLGGYSTGKAQELTKIVNELLGQTPLVYKKVFEQNRAYESQGVKLGNYIELNHNLGDADILIMPPHLIDDNLILALSHQLKRKVSVAIATGWNTHSKYKTFPLSDHADFNSLMRYVKESSPKFVLTTHGFEEEFASAVQKKLGIAARPLSRGGQLALDEFVA